MRQGKLLVIFCLLISSFFGIQPARAATANGLEALQVQMPGNVSMAPGESKTLILTLQNIGTKTWKNSGAGFVSIYTHGPKYRQSVFKSSSWISDTQPAKLKETSVAKGSVGTISLTLSAPTTTGTYAETFALASEDTAWISGGQFTINLTVATSASATSAAPTASSYQADVAGVSTGTIVAKGGISVVYTVTVTNTGSASWGPRRLQPSNLQVAGLEASEIQHKSWKSSSLILERSGTLAPGAADTFSFAFSTPKYKGSYDLTFQLTTEGQEIEGGEIDIPVEVTSDAKDVNGARPKVDTKSTTGTETAGGVYKENIIAEEPTMRVGVLIVDEETDNEVIVSSATTMSIKDTDGNLLAEVAAGKEVTAYYMVDKKKYYYEIDGEERKTNLPIRFVPSEVNAVLTVTNFDRRATRGSAFADNQFRNILEIRHNDTKERTWLINELSMEPYLWGLAETSNSSPAEFQKALMTAARTYGYYHFTRNTKHDAEGFTVDAYADQVYKGYGQELRNPTVVTAVNDTKGIIVIYGGDIAITAYFSRSDGRTRDWSEVWGGNVPWSKSVAVPWDVGKTLWGHGVGMSASGALGMANDGWIYDKILKYFYTGVELEKRWK